MTSVTALTAHHQVCDDLHQLALEENHFLRQYQRVPGQDFLDRKRSLLEKLDAVLVVLRTLPAASARDPETRDRLKKTRDRILQILQIDHENEQLLLRCSLTRNRPAAPSMPTAAASILQKIYARCQ
jgi:hypothetical protein